jgi:flagellin
MSFSINTNAGALYALQNLTQTSLDLQTVQNHINTGMAVSSAKDNAAVYAIAQNLRSNVAGLSAVSQSLNTASSIADVALAAGQAVADLLTQMKAKAVAAKDPGANATTKTALNNDFIQLRDQITTIVSNASFNGVNAVKNGGSKIVAITDDTGSSTISIAAQDLSLTGANLAGITAGATITTSALASAAVANLTTAITNVNKALSVLGAGSSRLTLQHTFVGKLTDALNVGIGNLVDANMAAESAKLQSLQVKQQLGLQALSIANQAPSAVMALFR